MLQMSTPKGKCKCCGLDPHKPESLLPEIHKRAFLDMSREEFSSSAQPKIYVRPSGRISRKVA